MSCPYLDAAAQVFSDIWQYSYNLYSIHKTPTLPAELTEAESKQILAVYGIPVVQTCVARSENEAVDCVNAIGYPVILELLSRTTNLNLRGGERHSSFANNQ